MAEGNDEQDHHKEGNGLDDYFENIYQAFYSFLLWAHASCQK